MPGHILVYLTANDQPSFLKDCLHLYHSARYNPGVDVEAYIAVSEVQPFSRKDIRILHGLAKSLEASTHIKVRAIILKSNVGRDFSSLYHTLNELPSHTQSEDYILVRNRTSWGPLKDGWYTDFIAQSKRFSDVALTGCTINLEDHYKRGNSTNVAHVQSYAYLSQWKYLSTLIPQFPGLSATTREEAIIEGEIEFSQRMLASGWCITCLQYPTLVIDKTNQHDVKSLDNYPKTETSTLPILRKAGSSRNRYYFRMLKAYASLWFHMLTSKKEYTIIRKS